MWDDARRTWTLSRAVQYAHAVESRPSSRALRATFGLAMLLGAAACGGPGVDLKDVVGGATDGGDGAVTTGEGGPHTAYDDPFAGAAAYAKPQPGNTAHNAGQPCMPCHGPSGSANKPFLIGGTVYQDYDGTKAAVGVEVRVVDGNGKAASAYSDSAGNFYILSGATNVALPAVVGVRNAQFQRPMITQLTGAMGACGQGGCHVSSGYGPLHIP